MKGFTEKQNSEIGITVYECDRCHVVEEQPEKHVCEDMKQRQEYIDYMEKKTSDPTLSTKERIQAYDDLEAFRKQEHDGDIKKLTEKYPDDVYRKVVREQIQERLKSSDEYLEKLYEKNDEMRMKGLPFAERKKYLDEIKVKVSAHKSVTDTYKDALQNLVLVPYQNFITEYDIELIRRDGYKKFIQFATDRGWTYKVNK